MSKYTTEVRYICEYYAGLDESVGFSDVDKTIAASRAKIFDFQYPIFDEQYRGVLESKILRHFYTQEIGFETVGLWKLKLQTKLCDIMPYYNQLYKSELLTFDPLQDVDLKTQRTTAGNSDSKSNSESENSSQSVSVSDNSANSTGVNYGLYSDTPQGGLEGVDTETYLSAANKAKSDANSTSNGTVNGVGVNQSSVETSSNINTTEQYIEHISGKNGGESYAKKLLEFRKTFLNIDMQIIRDLRSLFMYLW